MAASAALYDGLFVARLSRVLFSVLRSLFSGARQRPLCPVPRVTLCLRGEEGRSSKLPSFQPSRPVFARL